MPLRSRQKSAWGEAWAIICPSEQRPQLRQILAFSSKSGRSIVNQKAERIPKWETSASPSAFEPTHGWLTGETGTAG